MRQVDAESTRSDFEIAARVAALFMSVLSWSKEDRETEKYGRAHATQKRRSSQQQQSTNARNLARPSTPTCAGELRSDESVNVSFAHARQTPANTGGQHLPLSLYLGQQDDVLATHQ